MLSSYSGSTNQITCKVFRSVFSLHFLLLKSNQQIPQGEGGLGELSQTNLENLGSALLIFLDFNACLSISLPAPCWELRVFLSSLTAPCWECFLAQQCKHLNFMNKILMCVCNDPFYTPAGSRNSLVEGGFSAGQNDSAGV